MAGDWDGAADLLLRALEERPNALWIYHNLALVLYAAGRTEEVQESLAAMLQAYPDLAIAKYKEAMVFSPRSLEALAVSLRAMGALKE